MSSIGYRIRRGRIVFILVNDLGESADIGRASQHLKGGPRDQQLPFRPASSHRDFLGFMPEPLGLVSFQTASISIGDAGTATLGDIHLWPSGLVTYEFSVELTDCELPAVTAIISQIQTGRYLEVAAFNLSKQLIDVLKSFIVKPVLKGLAEDYVVVWAEQLEGPGDLPTIDALRLASDPPENLAELRMQIARILRPKQKGEIPAEQELRDTWEHVYQSTIGSFTVVDFNCAFVLGHNYSNILSVLLLAQVQMLTLRELTADLQARLPELEASAKLIIGHESANRRPWIVRVFMPFIRAGRVVLTEFGILTAPDDKVRRLMLDLHGLKAYALLSIELAAHLTDHFGDVSLHRLYDRCQNCFDFTGLSEKAQKRLDTLNEVLSELTSAREHHRSFFWELIVVILITIEVVKSFLSH